MLLKVGIIGCILVVLSSLVYAQETTPAVVESSQSPAVQAQVQEANRFLSAEVSRQIKASQDDMLKQLQANQDDNFKVLDQRTNQMMLDTRNRVIIGGLGAILVANGIIGLAYLYVTRRYSYERFLEKELGEAKMKAEQSAEKYGSEQKVVEQQVQSQMTPGMQVLQQGAWWPQEPPQTFSSQFGQVAASQATDMNQWQFQAPYEGAWKRPEQPTSRVHWQGQQSGVVFEEPKPWEIQQWEGS